MPSFTAQPARSLPVSAAIAASRYRGRRAHRGSGSSRSPAQQLEALLPMIAAYQRFYEVEEIDAERNRAFFSRFLAPSEDGMLLGAWRGEELAGYACLYWHFTSLVPAETVLMNDLYVAEAARGEGIGRALIEASAEVGRERGAHQSRVGDRPRQQDRPAPLRQDRRRAQRVGRVRAAAVADAGRGREGGGRFSGAR